jgi:hypothetical protein
MKAKPLANPLPTPFLASHLFSKITKYYHFLELIKKMLFWFVISYDGIIGIRKSV